jgi:hypothetical protein
VEALTRCNKMTMASRKNGQNLLISPLSEKLSRLLFDEEVSLAANSKGQVPKAGDIVKLVGRKPFPCVCEVTEENQSLVTDGVASLVAEGVKWQSLYLVMLNKHMILTEPVKGDSGGYGRVITICPLSCLMAECYDIQDQDTEPAAQRILLTHFSPSKHIPGLFNIEASDDPVDVDDIRIVRSCLDIWFEDCNSATKAHKALCSRIFKARIERGKQIRDALPHR